MTVLRSVNTSAQDDTLQNHLLTGDCIYSVVYGILAKTIQSVLDHSPEIGWYMEWDMVAIVGRSSPVMTHNVGDIRAYAEWHGSSQATISR